MSNHTVKGYDSDLDALGRKIAEMGGVAEMMVAQAIEALAIGDTELANKVIATDPRIDNLQREIDEQSISTLARRQPVGGAFREIIVAIRVSSDLERVGDLAKSVAKRAIRISSESGVARAVVGIKHM